ncbi:MAG: tyrosine-type recombinase/integrase [Dehalococcoidia bacterium]|jgi:integrase/recombinase XerC
MHDDTDILLFDNLTLENQELIRQMAIRLQPKETRAAVADLRQFVPLWKQHLSANGISDSTIRGYVLHVGLLLDQFPSPTKLDIEFYITALKESRSASTLNTKLAAWRSFFAWCGENNLTFNNPTAKQKNIRAPYNYRYPPEQDEVKKLLQLPLSLRDRALLSLLIDCGLRVAEVSLLLLANVTSKTATVLGKGNKWRTVPLTAECFKILAAYIDTLSPDTKYLFPGRAPGTSLSPKAIEDRLEALCKQAGLKKVTPHQLRHYFATYMLNNGANLKAVSQILGHTSVAITADIYWHTNEEINRKEHDDHSPLIDVERLINAPTICDRD